MELVDIYDAQGRPTGKVQDREVPLAAGEYLLAVGVWIVDGEGCILLTQRSPEKRWAPGKWENTAGHAQAGEDCPAAMAREIREEIGLEIAPEQLVPLGSASPSSRGRPAQPSGSPPRSWTRWPKAVSFPPRCSPTWRAATGRRSSSLSAAKAALC